MDGLKAGVLKTLRIPDATVGEKARNHACFIANVKEQYTITIIHPGETPVKAAVGNAVILLAKDVIYDEVLF